MNDPRSWDPDLEELRIALVMTGGVSLAVWIGGLTHEINRLVRADGVYGRLLQLLHTRVKVDVISGTSAGGINGALLAAALTRNCGLEELRDLWIDKSSLRALLRDPLDSTPRSLLKGDDYLMRQLRAALQGLLDAGSLTSPDDVPLMLFLTATLLNGESVELADDFGRPIADVRHKAVFKFVRSPDLATDDFATEDVADRLAMAARSTSSFPVAFEASFVRVGEAEDTEERPDMSAHVDFTSSRFVIDGGVLDNKPLGSAIDAIFTQRIDRDTRRVLAYVVPDPGQTSTRVIEKFEEAPHAAHIAAASLLNLPRVEPVADEIQAIRKRNREVLEARESRVRLTAGLKPKQAERTVRTLAKRLFPIYQAHRTDPAISYIVSQVSDGLAGLDRVGKSARKSNASDAQWNVWLERQSHRTWLAEAFRQSPLPWVPRVSPASGGAKDLNALQLDPAGWGWGLRLVENSMLSVLDILRTVQRIAPLGHSVRREDKLPALWRLTFTLLRKLESMRRWDGQYWKKQAQSLLSILTTPEVGPDRLANSLKTWAETRLSEWKNFRTASFRDPAREVDRIEAIGELGHAVAELLLDIGPIARDAADEPLASRPADDQRAAATLSSFLDYVVPKGAHLDMVLTRLAMLDVAQYALGGTAKLTDQYIEVIQISANTPTAFGTRALASEKLAGIQLGHFGAFYKRTWRANDWMYGRLDAAANLVQAAFSPDRLRRVTSNRHHGDLAASVCSQIENIVLPGPSDAEADEVLREAWNRDAAMTELNYLNRPDLPAPDSLPVCCAALIRRLQLEILRTDLVAIAEAQNVDESESSPEGGVIGQGGILARTVWSRLGNSGRGFGPNQQRAEAARGALLPRDAIEIFRRYNVGTERITDDVGSDLFSMTLAHTLAVTAAMASATSGGLGKAKHLMRVFRGVTLVFYFVVRNATFASRTTSALTAGVIATGATIVLLVTLGGMTQAPSGLLTAGWVILVGGMLSALIRRLYATMVITVAGVAIYMLRNTWTAWFPWVTRFKSVGLLSAILLVTLVLYSLGSIRRPKWWVERQLRKLDRRLVP